jgi:hypothetical protein
LINSSASSLPRKIARDDTLAEGVNRLRLRQMPVKFTNENEYGAYTGMRGEFLSKFHQIENNPNFDVFESKDGSKRLIASKSSRLPDDEDKRKGRFGIDFHRAKPTFSEAKSFFKELPKALQNREWVGNIAFAAENEDKYEQKSKLYDRFYSFIFGFSPKTIYVAPHSGNTEREPDDILPYPELEIDAWTAGVAALCAFNNKRKPSGRVMISVHGNGYLGAIIDLGGFGILDSERLQQVADKIGSKYHQRIKQHASEYKEDFFDRAKRRLKHIQKIKGTLKPAELQLISTSDRYDVINIEKGLKLYGRGFKEYTLEEFENLLAEVNQSELLPLSANYIFPGEKVGRLLELKERVESGLLNSAIQIECSKLYLKRDPELIAEIILDVQNELFPQ